MKRSTHNLSHEHKASMNQGQLIPLCTEEVLPGDTWVAETNLLARVAPMAFPLMHNVEVAVHHWYVPNRILWSEWEDFITGKNDALAVPTITLDTDLELCDHFGIYPETGFDVNALPFRAYNMIHNEFYRDQDLQTARAEDDDTLARVCWGKDYFTTARAQPQQGDAVQLGFSSGEVPIKGLGVYTAGSAATTTFVIDEAGGTTFGNDGTPVILSSAAALGVEYENTGSSDPATNPPLIRADLSAAEGGIDLDDLRQALALQRFAEARSRFGSRYVDYLRFLGVNPSDGRLDRPEYLGGGKNSLDFSEVLSTAEGATSDVGDLYGHGIGSLKSRRYRKMFEEHGWVLSLAYVRPKTSYLQAMPRKFTRSDVMDYWQKELEVLPWQQVPETEIYAPGNPANVFGYVPKFEEYRHAFNYVSGFFRSTELDWHMSRNLGSAPTLNSSFVECTPTDRIYGDTSMPEILMTAYNRIIARRLVSKSATLQGI